MTIEENDDVPFVVRGTRNSAIGHLYIERSHLGTWRCMMNLRHEKENQRNDERAMSGRVFQPA